MQTLPRCNIVVDFWNILPIMISFTFAAQTRVDLGVVSKPVIHWAGSFPDSHPWVNIPTTAPWCETHFLGHFEIQMFFFLKYKCKSTFHTLQQLHKTNRSCCQSKNGWSFNLLLALREREKSHSKTEWMFLSPFMKWVRYETSLKYLGFQHVIIKLEPNLHACAHRLGTQKEKVSWHVAMQGMFCTGKVTFRELHVLVKVHFPCLAMLV